MACASEYRMGQFLQFARVRELVKMAAAAAPTGVARGMRRPSPAAAAAGGTAAAGGVVAEWAPTSKDFMDNVHGYIQASARARPLSLRSHSRAHTRLTRARRRRWSPTWWRSSTRRSSSGCAS